MENQQLSQRENKASYMMKYNPKYREAHQEAIQETRAVYMQKKTVCNCGMEVIRNNLTQHLKTKKKTLKSVRAKKSRRIASI